MTDYLKLILLTVDDRVVTGADGHAATLTAGEAVAVHRVALGDGLWAARLDPAQAEELEARGYLLRPARELLDDRRVARALALVKNREALKFDPRTGSPVTFDEAGIVGHGDGGPIFPRTDPAVIGIVGLRGTDRILLGRGQGRDFFSLVAGYVDAGENLEEAFAREVAEETGRRVDSIRYWGSQPWPLGGSLMVGFTAETDDEEAVTGTDGELADVRWVDPDGARALALAGPGSIAHAMIEDWLIRTTGKGLTT